MSTQYNYFTAGNKKVERINNLKDKLKKAQ